MSTVSIILAEDEPSLGMIVKESLESRNFQVTLCKNGEEALMAYEKEKTRCFSTRYYDA